MGSHQMEDYAMEFLPMTCIFYVPILSIADASNYMNEKYYPGARGTSL